ncbi:MAG: uracil-DNA glycosylase [bacterium]
MTGKASATSIEELLADLLKASREYLVYQQENGMAGIDRKVLEKARGEDGTAAKKNPAEELRKAKRELGECTRCALSKSRTNIVFGEGDPFARIMFVGEAPGKDEDAQGLPFVGKSGKMLTDIIEKGMKISRSEVYITSVTKCHPPGERTPRPEEVETCFPFLKMQIESIKPKVIVALGAVAAQAITGSGTPISGIRGVWHEWNGIPVMPTYHPSYLLRKATAKKEVWEDIKKVMKKTGIPLEETK